MQNFRHIAQNAGHTVQNDGHTMQNVGRTTHNVSCNTLNVCQGPKGGLIFRKLGKIILPSKLRLTSY